MAGKVWNVPQMVLIHVKSIIFSSFNDSYGGFGKIFGVLTFSLSATITISHYAREGRNLHIQQKCPLTNVFVREKMARQSKILEKV